MSKLYLLVEADGVKHEGWADLPDDWQVASSTERDELAAEELDYFCDKLFSDNEPEHKKVAWKVVSHQGDTA